MFTVMELSFQNPDTPKKRDTLSLLNNRVIHDEGFVSTLNKTG